MQSVKRNYFNSALDSHSSVIFFSQYLLQVFDRVLLPLILQKFWWFLTESSGSLITAFASKCLNEGNVFSQYITVTFTIPDSLDDMDTIFNTGIHSTPNHELPPLYLTFLCTLRYNNAKFIGWQFDFVSSDHNAFFQRDRIFIFVL